MLNVETRIGVFGLPFLIAHVGIHGFDQLRALQQIVVNQEPERGGEKTKHDKLLFVIRNLQN